MTERSGPDGGDPIVQRALQDALSDRFDGVDWDRLHTRIMSDAAAATTQASYGSDASSVTGPSPAFATVADWSGRGIPVAATLLAAALAAVMLLSPERDAGGDDVPADFWPVAEELMSQVPAETRALIVAGTNLESLLTAVLSPEEKENGTT